MNNISLKIQITLSYLTIASAVLVCLFGLGFMTDFYTFFMNGDDQMFNFYKELQAMNSALFKTGLIFFVISLFLFSFDINKKTAGIFGVSYTLIIAIINIIYGVNIFSKNIYFQSLYEKLDYTAIEGYEPSSVPFVLINVLMGVSITFTVVLFILTAVNHRSAGIQRRQK